MKKIRWPILIIFFGVSLIVCPSYAADMTTTSNKLTLEKLKNSEYIVSGEKIKLTNGIYEHGTIAKGDLLLLEIGEVTFGELNSDGKEDAAVILKSSGGGSGVFTELAAVINKNGIPYHVASVEIGDRVKIQSISIKSEQIIVNMLKHGPSDPMCCPTLKTVVKYGLSGNKLIKK